MAERRCSVPGCDRVHYAKGFCHGHWQRWRRGKPLDAPFQRTAGGPCEVEGCTRSARAQGLCSAHYERRRRLGDVDASDPVGKHWRPGRVARKAIPGETKHLNNDGYVMVYDPEHPNAHKTGYVLEHRRVMAEVLGRPLFPDEIPHHKNGDRTDNRPGNLELCVRRQPPGQRVADLLPWAREIVERYEGRLF